MILSLKYHFKILNLDSPAPRRIADAVRSKIEKFNVHLFVLGKRYGYFYGEAISIAFGMWILVMEKCYG